MDNQNRKDDSKSLFIIYRCTRPECGLRFTVEAGKQPESVLPVRFCPACRAMLQTVGEAYPRLAIDSKAGEFDGPALEVILDNIRSAWNVGSMFRTCDGAGVRRMYLCGVTSLPDNPKVIKTSLGAETSVPWNYAPDGVSVAQLVKAKGLRLWALEGGPRASLLFSEVTSLPGAPIALVVGNEVSGVDPGILDLCEKVVSLPMQGVKGSLNVAVAFGIAVYFIRYGRIK